METVTFEDAGDNDILLSLFSDQGDLLFKDTETVSLAESLNFNEPSAKKNGNPNNITSEDYIGEELFAYYSIKNSIRNAIIQKASKAEQGKAIEWLFVPNIEDSTGLTFSLCCDALSVRENLVRTRLQYEFFRKEIQVRLPFLCVDVPDSFELEASGIGGDDAKDMIKFLWANPGLRSDLFKQAFADINNENFSRITLDLEASGMIAITKSFWYFTGRNPLIMKFGSNFNWSRVPVF